MKKTPAYVQMASGSYALILEEGITYDNFPTHAKKWLGQLSLNLKKKIDGAGERVWECERAGCTYWLAFDDSSPQLSLEPCDEIAGVNIFSIGQNMGLTEPEAKQ